MHALKDYHPSVHPFVLSGRFAAHMLREARRRVEEESTAMEAAVLKVQVVMRMHQL
jgi:hypothetical protein